ncbi:wnt oncogene analog 2 isoform X2 [Rhodnius prolixus]
MCRTGPDLMIALGQGVSMALAECHAQFAKHRWDCTHLGKGHSFGYVLVVGSREAAYTYSIASAGVVYSIMAACSRGEITSCGCGTTNRRQPRVQASWKWAGCSVDLALGLRIARKFLDNREVEGDARALMNLHNNKAGRNAIKTTLVKDCKCHGVSGSCTMRSCWMSLPRFKKVGDHLMRKYWRAREVRLGEQGSLVTGKSDRKPRTADLVFIEHSPNYCEPDNTIGSPGTKGRNCNRSATGLGSCDELCCGRGYNTHQQLKSWQCNCKFNWCCQVECQTCTQNTEVYTCK